MNSMSKFKYAFLLFFILPIFGVAQSLESQFQNIVDSVFEENDSALGILIHIEAPDLETSWTAAVGENSKTEGTPLRISQPVLIASNTKTYVSAAILRLVEMKKITLDQSIETLIHKNSRHLLNTDGYNLSRITVKHLLSHTSGIADYVNDDYFEYINAHPNYLWKRSEQIQRTVEVGEPLYKPGTGYTYADVNFLLLTEIIEQHTDVPFYQAIAELLDFESNGLYRTWFKDLDMQKSDTEPLAHQYYDKYNWDSYKLNPSWDLYGGGGLASTVKELGQFFNLLFNGEIIKNKAVLKEMYTYVLPVETSRYCLGLMKISFHGKDAYYHGGFWGTDVMYIPEYNLTIALVTLQKDKRMINSKICELIVQAIESNSKTKQ